MSVLTSLFLNSATNPLLHAIHAVGFTVERDDFARPVYVPRAALRVELTDRPGAGVLCAVTHDGWLELRLDGEDRTDEYLQSQVRLQAPTEAAGCAAPGGEIVG